MPESALTDSFVELDGFDEFDPLAVDDFDIDQENMDDDNPYDTVDFPTMRNMPDVMQREAVYTPERQGGASEALLAMMDRNPARRPVLVAILDMCEGGLAASAVAERVDDLQRTNRSVYAPMTLCRMLERAGGLTLEMPDVTEQRENAAEGVEYLEIKEAVDPVWRTTDAGRAVRDALSEGGAFRDIVMTRDATYLAVYAAVMDAASEQARSKKEIDDLVDEFAIVREPRRFGGHFIDMLERTDTLAWNGSGWILTDLGRRMRALIPA